MFEGVDGSGKSTQIKKLQQFLLNNNYDVVLTREPGGTFSGEIIRTLFLQNNFSQELQYLLMLAARAEHIDSVILPALSKNKIVLSDRYCDSTNVYQTTDNKNLSWIAQKLTKNILPTITILLNIDPKKSLQNIDKRLSFELDIVENQLNEELICKRQQKYLQIAKENPNKYAIINANQTPELVHRDIVAIIKNI